jgi:hypothetical protein
MGHSFFTFAVNRYRFTGAAQHALLRNCDASVSFTGAFHHAPTHTRAPAPVTPPAPTHLGAGAELAGLCREAALGALREDFSGAQQVAMRHFEAALAAARPSLTPALLQKYEAWSRRGKPGSVALGGATE